MRVTSLFTRAAVVGATALALAAFATPARASVVLDFGDGGAGAGGLFTLTGGGNATGAHIPIDALTVFGTGANDGVYDVVGTCTGTGNGSESGVGCLDFNTSTNTISITGSVTGLPGNVSTASEALLSGSLLGWTADSQGLHGAFGPDGKARDLLLALGLPANTPFAYFGFSLAANGSGSPAISTDIKNTSVPEPGSMLLLGSGLLGLGGAIRRRFAK
jgi:hypothetical protein